jgi:GT2 family glycosyltransferase
MYSDEVDIGIRAKKNNFKIAVTQTAIAWHQHINLEGLKKRQPYTFYLRGRNKIYLAGKHYGFCRKMVIFIYHLLLFSFFSLRDIFNKENRIDQYNFLKGSYNGLIGRMSLSKIIRGNMNE